MQGKLILFAYVILFKRVKLIFGNIFRLLVQKNINSIIILLQRINHGDTNRTAVFSLVYNLRRNTLWNPATASYTINHPKNPTAGPQPVRE